MKKFILTALSGFVLCVSIQAMAEELTIYAEPITITVSDHGAKGYSLGDTVARNGPVYFQVNGPAVGEYFTLAQITHIYKDRKSDARFYVMEINLPEGEIMTMNFSQIKSGGPTAVEGEKHRGVIVGGTGKYSGIKGTYEMEIGANQKTKIVFKII